MTAPRVNDPLEAPHVALVAVVAIAVGRRYYLSMQKLRIHNRWHPLPSIGYVAGGQVLIT